MPPEVSRRALIGGALALSAAGCARRGPPAETAFQGFVAAMTEAAVADLPERAIARGAPISIATRSQRYGFDQRAPLAEELRRTALVRWSAQLLGFEPRDLAPAERTTRSALALRLVSAQACAAAPFGRLDLFTGFRPYRLCPGWSTVDSAQTLLAGAPLAGLGDAEALIERFSRAPATLRDELAAARADAQAGARLPAGLARRLAATFAAEAAAPGGRTLALVRRRLAGLALGPEDAARLAFAADRIGADFARAVAEGAAVIGQVAGGEEAGALVRMPQGDAIYPAILALTLGAAADPQEVKAAALAEVAEATGRLDMALRGLGYAQGAPLERYAGLAVAPDAAFTPDAAGAAAFTAEAQRVAQEAQTFAARMVTTPPEVWPGLTLATGAAEPMAYRPLRLDGGGAARAILAASPGFAANRFDLARLIVQAYLGRHLPAERTRLAGPPLARQLVETPGFAEGFALYAEGLAEEAGLFERAPLSRIGHLRARIEAAALAAADIAIHAEGAAPAAQAERLSATAGLAPAAALALVEDMIARPGRAVAAAFGRAAIERIREAARSRLGPRFDIRAFHDLVTREGEVPLATLQDLAAAWSA